MDEDRNVRRRAIEILIRLGDTRAVEPLIQVLLKDEAWEVRGGAAIALGKIGDERAVKPLYQALKKEEKKGEWGVIEAVKEALEEIRYKII